MPVNVFHPKVKKILRQAERRIIKLTENPTLNLVILKNYIPPIPYEDIENIVCEVTGIPIEKAVKLNRQREFALTRQLIAFFAKEYCKMGYQAIADKLNRSDHTTMISSVRRIKQLIESGNSEVCEYVKEINQRIEPLKKLK